MSEIKKVAVVTGGGSGIGSAVCRRLATTHTVVIVYSNSKVGALAVSKEIENAGGESAVFSADIAVEEHVINLFKFVKERFGRVDVVINNAGIGNMTSLADVEMSEYDRLFNTNARGTFMMCREAARHIQDGGRIINVSTGATKVNFPGQCLYVGSKLAVEGFTKVLARELGPRGITVNTVSPGMTDTPLLAQGDAAMLKEFGAQMSAMKRCGQPEDIADAVAALVSNDCRWITGENISVSGGSTIV